MLRARAAGGAGGVVAVSQAITTLRGPWHLEVEIGQDGTGEGHIWPEYPGEREHVLDRSCWCGPVPDVVEPRILIHERRAEA